MMNKLWKTWKDYEKHCVPDGAEEVQRRHTRMAFYAGASTMLSFLCKEIVQGASEEEVEANLFGLLVEVDAFRQSVIEAVQRKGADIQ